MNARDEVYEKQPALEVRFANQPQCADIGVLISSLL
jgi:hypothetical protein